MTQLRRSLGRIAVALVLSQAAMLALVPVVMLRAVPGAVAPCVCAHGDEATCPMHHQAAARGVCVIHGTQTGVTVGLQSLVGVGGVIPVRTHAIVPMPTEILGAAALSTPAARPSPPEPPPPRA